MSSSKTAASSEGLILAGGSGMRLGMGPKAFVMLGGLTLLERAVQTMLEIFTRVIVALPKEHLAEGNRLINDSRVSLIAGGKRRIETLRLLVQQSSAEWLVLHDVVHPFVSAELVRAVLGAASVRGAAAAAHCVNEFLYDTSGTLIAQPGHTLMVQKPIAFRSSAVKTGFYKADILGLAHDASVLEILSLAGVAASFIDGHPWNQKITNSLDFELAETLLQKIIHQRN